LKINEKVVVLNTLGLKMFVALGGLSIGFQTYILISINESGPPIKNLTSENKVIHKM